MVFNYSSIQNQNATKHAPFKKTLKDAGFDVPAFFFQMGQYVYPSKGSNCNSNCHQTYFPATHVALVRSRSGLSVKHDIKLVLE